MSSYLGEYIYNVSESVDKDLCTNMFIFLCNLFKHLFYFYLDLIKQIVFIVFCVFLCMFSRDTVCKTYIWYIFSTKAQIRKNGSVEINCSKCDKTAKQDVGFFQECLIYMV